MEFFGRSKEVAELSESLYDNNDSKVVCITGEAGVGKSKIADHLFENRKNKPDGRFKILPVRIDAYQYNWDYVITNLARKILGELPPKNNYRELEDEVLKTITEPNKTVFVFLDDLDQVKEENILRFSKSWASKKHKSILLMTRRTCSLSPSPSTVAYQLHGLNSESETEKWLIKKFLGDMLSKIIEEKNLWKILSRLKYNPQKLRYLRYLSPVNEKGIRACVEGLDKEKEREAIDIILQKSPYPFFHFLALGRINITKFDELLLAFLWDILGGGSTEMYFKALEWLLSEDLLEFGGKKSSPRREFFICPGVHIHLNRLLIHHFGEKRAEYIDFYIAQYFRKVFTEEKNTKLDLGKLSLYVSQALKKKKVPEIKDFESTYKFIFETDILDIAHSKGLSLELESILELFNNYFEDLKKKDSFESLEERSSLWLKGACIKIELGHVYNDLSRHEECLKCMEEALKLLEVPEINKSKRNELHKSIWYFSGVSYSDLGKSKECINNYERIIKSAVEEKSLTRFDVLALGYLGHEWKFHDMAKGERIGTKALDLSREIGHQSTIMKNMCNLAQMYFFNNKKEEAKRLFEEAFKICQEESQYPTIDLREKGRVLIHRVMICIADKELGKAEEYIKEGYELNTRFGDRRRAATAKMFEAIIKYHNSEIDEAKEIMFEAIKQHLVIKDWRNLVFDVLSYLFINDPNFNGDLQEREIKKIEQKEIYYCANHIFHEKKDLQVFITFWKERFKPLLLE